MDDAPLRMRVLLVEDEFLLADHLADVVTTLGATPVGPAASIGHALALIDCTPDLDAAILDVNLDGEQVFPVADRLAGRGVPFVFSSGYDIAQLPQPYRQRPVLDKLVCLSQVRQALVRMRDGARP